MRATTVAVWALLGGCMFAACGGSDDEGNAGSSGKGGSANGGGSGGGAADASSGATGTGATGTGATGTGASGNDAWYQPDGGCNISGCTGHIYECGDCVDNDGDGLIDSQDSDCLGPCDNTENGYYPDLPGTTGAECKADCFWDNGNGSGNDDCYWDHQCDPLEVAPDYPPEGPDCQYDSTTKVGGGLSCDQASKQQSKPCLDYCGPLVPNGCDCFGCCILPGAPTPVWMGSVANGTNDGTCFPDVLGDPSKCKPCTMVPGCGNDCQACEVCIGKPKPDPSCYPDAGTGDSGSGYDGGIPGQCPAGVTPCGLEGQAPCAAGFYCITGCCRPLPT